MATQPERLATVEQRVTDQENRCARETRQIHERLGRIEHAIQGNGGDSPGGLRGDILVIHTLLKEHLQRDRRRETWMWRAVVGALLVALGTAGTVIARAFAN